MNAVCLALALATSAQEPAPVSDQNVTPTPPSQVQLQARAIFVPDGSPSRGVSAFVPKDGNGYRYYYSRSQKGKPGTKDFSESSIESWSDQTGRPLRAHYEMRAASYYLRTDLTIEKDKIVFEETLVKSGFKPSFARVSVPVVPGTSLQLSQFHPMDVPLEKDGTTQFTLVDPIAKRAELVRLTLLTGNRTDLGPYPAEGVRRYRIEGSESWTEIELDESGRFQRMIDSSGTIMNADTPLPNERGELNRILSRARQSTEDRADD